MKQLKKAFFRARVEIVNLLRKKSYYYYLYRSYWHLQMQGSDSNNESKNLSFFAANPNPGAGVGHQLSNWIAGYIYAKKFGLKFSHIKFPNEELESFMGFGVGEVDIRTLLDAGYKKVRLPLFDEVVQPEVDKIQKIIKSYGNKKVIFIAEQDQFCANQYLASDALKKKFYNATSRAKDKIIYSQDTYNIAIHVRRGDISIGQLNKNPNLIARWQDNEYFKNILLNVMKRIVTDKPIFIYLFSQGRREDFKEFEQFSNLNLCLEMGVLESFLHMAKADLLITSKSSFSYKPALLNKGTKVCPKNFWHGYPNTSDWILAEEDGNFHLNTITHLL